MTEHKKGKQERRTQYREERGPIKKEERPSKERKGATVQDRKKRTQ